jgi:hypothetical protein
LEYWAQNGTILHRLTILRKKEFIYMITGTQARQFLPGTELAYKGDCAGTEIEARVVYESLGGIPERLIVKILEITSQASGSKIDVGHKFPAKIANLTAIPEPVP